MTDPVSDFLTRLRNAAKAQHHDVLIPSSRLKRELARILKEEGYIDAFEIVPPSPGSPGEAINVTLKYTDQRKPVIRGCTGCRARASAPMSITPTSRGSRAAWAPRSSRPREA